MGVFACGMGGGGNPWIGGTRKDSPIAMVKTGADSPPLRLRVPFAQLQQVVDAIRLEATKVAGPGPEKPDPDTSSPETPASN